MCKKKKHEWKEKAKCHFSFHLSKYTQLNNLVKNNNNNSSIDLHLRWRILCLDILLEKYVKNITGAYLLHFQ